MKCKVWSVVHMLIVYMQHVAELGRLQVHCCTHCTHSQSSWLRQEGECCNRSAATTLLRYTCYVSIMHVSVSALKQHFLLVSHTVCALQALVAAVLRPTKLIGNPELPALALIACPLQHCHLNKFSAACVQSISLCLSMSKALQPYTPGWRILACLLLYGNCNPKGSSLGMFLTACCSASTPTL